MPLWKNAEVAQDGLKDLLRLAHLYAYGEIEHENYQEHLWVVAQPIMQEENVDKSLVAARDARDCALFAASHNLIPALSRADGALRAHHGTIARSCAYEYKAHKEDALRKAWEKGGPISFEALFAVTSKHILAAIEAEIWHVAYTISDEMFGFIEYDNISITEKEMESFLLEALEPAAKDIAHDVLHKSARLMIDAAMAAISFEEAESLAHESAQRVFKDACSAPDMYEQLAIGRTAVAATCHDFEDHETFALCHARHYLHEGSFYKVHPINQRTDGIAKGVALNVCLEQLAYAAACSYAGDIEMAVQADVLGRLLAND